MKTGTVTLGNASLHIGYSGIVNPNKRGLLREITEFHVPETLRGKGDGSKLLDEVCKQADNENIILMIRPDNQRLQAFYAKYGFIAIQDNDVTIMARKPQIAM